MGDFSFLQYMGMEEPVGEDKEVEDGRSDADVSAH